ncbi:MAG: SH3 domain-containing protein [Woeseiaceae bacterium]|nr:SH3 domain-containing protein [Woeseiaceae bacterium]MDX2608342.1 SH3 domain-containing protein [Woeseiaceae bacterium]
MHLSADYWVNKTTASDKILKNQDGIDAFNDYAFAHDPNMVNLAGYPEQLSGEEVASIIQSISKPYDKDLFYRDGGKLADADYGRYTASLNLDDLRDTVPIRFGMVLQRADMRTWPTEDVVFKSQETFDLDRFQENGLFPANAVAVLHESEDGLWYFVQSFNYAAWVQKNKIVIGPRPKIVAYKNAARFLVVTGSKVTTNFNPHAPAISELQLDMGVRLPLADPDTLSDDVDGQNPYASYAVQLPVRNENGELDFRTALIARSQDIYIGYLPYTRRNIIQQAFKFLGERYGWGHSYNARDCTGLVSEVYKTVGIFLPRNSSQQGNSPIGENIRFSADDPTEVKLKALTSVDVGDLLYSKGHVMLYLGTVDDQPFVIHDLSGSGWTDEDGNYQEGVLNGVSVTPLMPIHSSQESTYFDQMYSIKKIR